MCLYEVAAWECPCDEEFWAASTARVWKSLLGSGSLPPAPTFAMASGPYLHFCQRSHSGLSMSYTPIPRVRTNRWTDFLVLLSLSKKALEWSHEWMFATAIILETTDEADLPAVLAELQEAGEFDQLHLLKRNILGDYMMCVHIVWLSR